MHDDQTRREFVNKTVRSIKYLVENGRILNTGFVTGALMWGDLRRGSRTDMAFLISDMSDTFFISVDLFEYPYFSAIDFHSQKEGHLFTLTYSPSSAVCTKLFGGGAETRAIVLMHDFAEYIETYKSGLPTASKRCRA